jgi:ABC-type sugar transport system ATPase subunit
VHKKPILKMKNISKNFGCVKALQNVSIELYSGDVLALMGENGAGKSTLMNVLCGAITSYEGEIFIEGNLIKMHSPTTSRNAGIAMIHQELQLVPELTVAENIYLGREPRNFFGLVDNKKMNQMCEKYLNALELNINPSVQIKNLRIGEQQLIEIAKALSLNANILIMDEPTSALSKAESQKLFKIVNKLSNEGVAIIYITHRMEEIFAITNRVTVMRDGQYIGTVNTVDVSKDDIIAMMVGRTLSELFPKEIIPRGNKILEVKNLNFYPKEYQSSRALRDISFDLHKGEVLGIAGLMGAGRSELFDCIFGLNYKQTECEMFIEGNKVTIKKPLDAINNKIAYVTEDRKDQGLVLCRSIGENMSFPLLNKYSKRMFMDTKKEKKDWNLQMKNLRIKAPTYYSLVSSLSGGNQQKVILGRWLLTRPNILLLDEPTRGIDVGAKSEIYRLINKLASEGMGIIVISSELPEIIGVSDRIITLCEGKVTGEFMRDDFSQEKILEAATLTKEGDLCAI